MRVLMLGAGERYHLEPLARCIKAADPAVALEMLGLREPKPGGGTRPVTSSPVFDALHQPPVKPGRNKEPAAAPASSPAPGGPAATSPAPAVAATQTPAPASAPVLPPVIGKGWISRFITRATRAPDGLAEPWQIALRVFWNLYQTRRSGRLESEHLERISANADILHLQSLFEPGINRWLLRSGKSGYVVSCWGSDVLRNADYTDFLVQKTLLQRAAVITITGPEFKEIFLAKFGRDLEPKIRSTYFNPGVEALRPCLRSASDIAAAGRSCPFRVCLGHNGFEGGSHLDLLSGFGRLDPADKARIELTIPMTYGGSPAYREKVRAAATATGCAFRILDVFMSDEEVMRLRAETDILIFAPVSDALAATVTQSLACGAALVSGAWLPYRGRARAGFSFTEIERPGDAADATRSIMERWQDLQPKLLRNRELAFELFSEKNLGQGWISAYQSALQTHRTTGSCKQ